MPVIYIRKASNIEDPILQVASRMESRMRQAFLDAVAAVKGTIALPKLTKAVESGDVNGVMAILALDTKFTGALKGVGLEAGINSVRDAVQATFAAAAKTAAMELPKRISVDLSFNLMNPQAVNFLESYSFEMIHDITAETRQAVQQVLMRAFKEGGAPVQQAREIRDMIGLTARQEKAIQNYRAALESGTSSDLRDALSRSLRDGRYDRTLLRAIEESKGLGADKIDQLVGRYRERYLQYRATMIARTETVRASNAGQRELWRQAKEQGLLKHDQQRRWHASGDDRTCAECDGLDGEEAGLDEEFAPGIMDPPDPHPDCRCSTSLVFSKAA